MSQPVRAIYENGLFRPLEEVDLPEGEAVELMYRSSRDRLREALGDLVASWPDPSVELEDEEVLMAEVRSALKDQRPLSQDIIEERRNGP